MAGARRSGAMPARPATAEPLQAPAFARAVAAMPSLELRGWWHRSGARRRESVSTEQPCRPSEQAISASERLRSAHGAQSVGLASTKGESSTGWSLRAAGRCSCVPQVAGPASAPAAA